MSSNFDDVGRFHTKFGLPESSYPGPRSRELSDDVVEFRIEFLREELKEFIEGCDENDPVKMADALIDIVYVAMGTAHLMGLPWQHLWDEVHRANMTKQRASSDGSDSKRSSPHDVVKPTGWRPPAIAAILRAWGWRNVRDEYDESS